MTDEPTPSGGGTHHGSQLLQQSETDRRALFAECWPPAASRVLRMLLALGADRHTAEELVQETAFRVWRSEAPFDSPADLAAYARKVALNLRVALFRRSARLARGEVPVVVAADDPAAEAEARIALGRTLTELAAMADTDRRAILYGVWGDPEGWDSADYKRWKMRRSRAREKLRALVEGAAAVVGLARRGRRWLEVEAGPVTAAAVAVAACLLPAVVTLLPVDTTSPSAALGHRSPAVAVVSTAVVPASPPADGPALVRTGDDRRASRDDAVSTQIDQPGSPSRPAPILATPRQTEDLTGTGTVTPHDGDELLRVCTKDDPVLGTGCPVSVTPPSVLPDRNR